MRLDRLISNLPHCSRQSARQLIAEGRVRVNGEPVRDGLFAVDRFMAVSLDHQPVQQASSACYLMLNKPAGFLSATRDAQHLTVMELLPETLRPLLHIAGRLDRSSTGLLLLSNDGLWSRRLSEPKSRIAKLYQVRTLKPISPQTASRFAEGIYFAREKLYTSPAELQQLDDCKALLSIYEGRYHQVKRMFHAVGNQVVALHRLAVGDIHLGELLPGQYRALTPEEISGW